MAPRHVKTSIMSTCVFNLIKVTIDLGWKIRHHDTPSSIPASIGEIPRRTWHVAGENRVRITVVPAPHGHQIRPKPLVFPRALTDFKRASIRETLRENMLPSSRAKILEFARLCVSGETVIRTSHKLICPTSTAGSDGTRVNGSRRPSGKYRTHAAFQKELYEQRGPKPVYPTKW